MKLAQITTVLEEFAPLHLQEDFDNSGLIFGDPNMDIKGALTSLDCVEAVVDEAIALDCNLIIAHHPIVFKGIKQLCYQSYVEKTLIKAIQNNIAIYAIHTNLDNVKGGINFKMAEKLNLQEPSFLKAKAMEGGSGAVGNLPTPLSPSEFLDLIKNNFHNTGIRHTEFLKDKIQKIALCGGSGSFLLQDAIAQKADIFLSSDFKYHQFFDAEKSITIVDIGHFEAEILSKALIHNVLTKKFPNFAVRLSKINTNPVKYY